MFDEAQRAWDAKYGFEKFKREASEPRLLLELMSRHADWCVCVCLIGVGQEINSGEEGIAGWGDALRDMTPAQCSEWTVFAPEPVLSPVRSNASLGTLPEDLDCAIDKDLELRVSKRTYRSPSVSGWVDQVLAGDSKQAYEFAQTMERYPVVLTRSLLIAKKWLREHGRGERRYGLLASSGARRLRAEGLGVSLHATSGDDIAHWYLNSQGDIRSSYALEVTANEYTCQGLELDYVGVCWDGDLFWDEQARQWSYKRLSGDNWQRIADHARKQFVANSYRVLLTRAREGMVIWVPRGDNSDKTRPPAPLDATANYLQRCGAGLITESKSTEFPSLLLPAATG